jgi:localization factor PodJL
LIAAARRAAAETAARQNAAADPDSPHAGAKNRLADPGTGASLARKPILVTVIGLIIVLTAIGASRFAPDLGGFLTQEGTSPAQQFPVSAVPQGVTGDDDDQPRPSGSATTQISPQVSPQISPRASPRTPAPQPAAPARQGLAAPTAPPFAESERGDAGSGEAADAMADEPATVGSIQSPSIQASPKPASNTAVADVTGMPDFVSRLQLAADADDPIAEYELAKRMYAGRGLPRDQQRAAKLFERAANKGLVPAQYRIANIYETGLGAAKDLVLARAWLEKAAARGNAKAMHNFGVYLAQGVEGKPDYAAAVAWFRQAAEHDIRDSQYNLAVLLERGLGAVRDFKASYIWFALAARGGDSDSARKRDEVAAQLSKAELEEAKSVIAQWKPVALDRAANEVDPKGIDWDRLGPATKPADGPRSGKL